MISTSPLDDVEFLARSAHRVAVLRTLAEAPHSRSELHDETGISQPTLGRVLRSLQDHNWVEQDGREYALTPFGEIIAEEFTALLDTVETVQQLSHVAGSLPTEQMDFDIRQFADATVTTPETGDPFRHVRRVEELVYDADHLRLLSNTIAPGSMEEWLALYDDFIRGNRVVESVISADTLDQVLVDDGMVDMFDGFVDMERAQIYRYEGSIPQMVGVADGIVFVVPTDDQGLPVAVVETSDETVLAWAEETIDDYLAQSTKLTSENLLG